MKIRCHGNGLKIVIFTILLKSAKSINEEKILIMIDLCKSPKLLKRGIFEKCNSFYIMTKKCVFEPLWKITIFSFLLHINKKFIYCCNKDIQNKLLKRWFFEILIIYEVICIFVKISFFWKMPRVIKSIKKNIFFEKKKLLTGSSTID